MMGIGWDEIKKLGIERMTCEVMVVNMGQTSKFYDTLIIPAVSNNNIHLPQTKGGAKKKKLSINEVGIILVSDQVCAEVFMSITLMAVLTLDFGDVSDLHDHFTTFE